MDEELKNEYFEKKEKKEQDLKRQNIRKTGSRLLKYLIILVIMASAGYWLYSGITQQPPPKPGQFFEAQSRDHIASDISHPEYNSNPPTGGWHYNQPAQTGIYDIELPDEKLVHNLEHGHIWISYHPDLPKGEIEKLADITSNYGLRIIMTMRAKNDSLIAMAAWQHLLKLDTVDEKAIREFVAAHRNIAGPERNIPDSGFGDFRAKK